MIRLRRDLKGNFIEVCAVMATKNSINSMRNPFFLTNKYRSRWKTKQGEFVELHLTDTHIKKYLGFDLFRACICIFSVEMNCLQNYGACEKA